MKLLLVPVSAARGFGEYARTREIAFAVQQRWPAAQLHFLLSAQAPYATQCPFPATLLPGSATLHTRQVVQLLQRMRPDIVIFDNAGRGAQIRAARACGARVIYISSRRRQRAKAFRLRWMRLLAEHWIAYPRFIAGELGWWEKLKIRLLGRPQVRFADTVLALGDAPDPLPQLTDFVLVVPGGGTAHPGAQEAPAIIAAAARSLAARGLCTVLVGVDAGGEAPLLNCVGLLPQAQLSALLRRAAVVLTNGGDTLLQALACGCACVAVPIAHDQARRIARCQERGLLESAPLEASAIVAAVGRLQADAAGRAQLRARVAAAGITNALPWMLEVLGTLGAADPR